MAALVRGRAMLALIAAIGLSFAPLAFFFWHRATFGAHAGAVFLDLLFAICCVSLAVLAGLLVARVVSSGSRLPLLTTVAVAALQSGFFFTVYIGSFYANRFWGDSLTWPVVGSALSRPDVVLDFMAVEGNDRASLMLALIGAAVLLSLAAAWLAIGRTMLAALGPDRWRTAPIRQAVGSLAVALGLSVMIVTYVPTATHGEPVLEFFNASPSRNLLDWDNDRVLAALNSRQSELNYPPVRKDTPRKNVVIIYADSWRADRLGVYGYPRPTTPFLSEIVAQKKAVAVDLAFATCAESYCGIGSTLASLPYNKLSPESFKLNSVLKRAGYRVSYYLAGDHRTWRYLWDFYGNDIDDMRDCTNRQCHDPVSDAELVADFEKMEPFDGQPRFIFVFLMSTHILGTKLDQFQKFQHLTPLISDVGVVASRALEKPQSFDGFGVPNYRPMTTAEVEALSNRYDDGSMQADAMIRRMFSALDDKGYLKNSMVVIGSDHGDGLGERGHVAHGRFLYQQEMHVPLIIYDSEASAYPDLSFAAQIDIAPTILDRVGLPIPSSWEGVPLTRPMATRSTLHQTRFRPRPCAGAVQRLGDEVRKYIRCRTEDGRLSEELFDLKDDPSESRNLIGTASAADLAKFRGETARLVDGAVCSGEAYYCERH